MKRRPITLFFNVCSILGPVKETSELNNSDRAAHPLLPHSDGVMIEGKPEDFLGRQNYGDGQQSGEASVRPSDLHLSSRFLLADRQNVP
jgi:hypothetical protein